MSDGGRITDRAAAGPAKRCGGTAERVAAGDMREGTAKPPMDESGGTAGASGAWLIELPGLVLALEGGEGDAESGTEDVGVVVGAAAAEVAAICCLTWSWSSGMAAYWPLASWRPAETGADDGDESTGVKETTGAGVGAAVRL